MRYLFLTLLCLIIPNPTLALEANKDIPYVEGSDVYRQKLDIFTPYQKQYEAENTEIKNPVMLFVHGGGWSGGDKKHLSSEMVEAFTRQDVIVVAINYRLAPKNPFPAGMEDLAHAVKWVHENIGTYGGDPDNIVLVGHSSGAHMVALLGVDASYLAALDLSPKMLKAIFPVDTASFDLTVKRTGEAAKLVNFMVLRAFGDDEVVLKKASPIHQVAQHENADRLPPFHLYVTAAREEAMLETQRFMDELLKINAEVEFDLMGKFMSHEEMKDTIFDPFSPLHKDIIARLQQ